MPFVILIVAVIAVIAVVIAIKNKNASDYSTPVNQTANQDQSDDITGNVPADIQKLPFERKYLLTKNEYYFYKELKKIADKYNLVVQSKIRFADIVQVKNSEIDSKSEWYSNFGKIKSKHIDFALANPENLYVLLIIELDDNSHNTEAAKKKDEFLNSVLEKCGYQIIRTRGPHNVEEQIVKMLNIDNTVNNQSRENDNG